MYRGATVPFSSCTAAASCGGVVFASMDTLTLRFCRGGGVVGGEWSSQTVVKGGCFFVVVGGIRGLVMVGKLRRRDLLPWFVV